MLEYVADTKLDHVGVSVGNPLKYWLVVETFSGRLAKVPVVSKGW
jgi:hypothetical protein